MKMMGEQNIQQFATKQLSHLLDRASKAVRSCSEQITEEAIHDLRVSLRRFDETLRAFKALFPKPHYQIVHKEVREILRAAGQARDIDIALAAFHQAQITPSSALSAQLKAQRITAERELFTSLKASRASKFSSRWRSQLSLSGKNLGHRSSS